MIKLKVTITPDPKTLRKQIEKQIEKDIKRQILKDVAAKQKIATSGSRKLLEKSPFGLRTGVHPPKSLRFAMSGLL